MENSPPIDRISNLPDELLSHILSFLPTKLAFTTTLLSKRWNPLFKLLTSLDLDDESVSDEDSFLHLCRWFETVKRHPVDNLQIHISHIPLSLPPTIFIFPNLVLLELNFVDVIDNISVHLPSLKTLHLYAVQFKNKRSFNNLVYGCPVLEHLLAPQVFYACTEQVEGSITVNTEDNTEEFKSLSKLTTADINAFYVPFRAISNVKILRLWMMKRLLEINSYYGGSFPVFQNLINLNIGFCKFHHWDDVVEVLRCCPKLQILSIFKLAIKDHLSINWNYPNVVLECISSHLRSCTINYEGWENELRFTKYILQNARLLQVMKINICHSSYQKPNLHPLEKLYSCPMISPQCKLSIGY